MKKIAFLCMALYINTFNINAQPTLDFIFAIEYDASITDMNCDFLYNLYLTGIFREVGDRFEPKTDPVYYSPDANDIFIVKYDNNYNLLWVNHIGGNLNGNYPKIAIDHDLNVFVTCTFKDTVYADVKNMQGRLIDLNDGMFLTKSHPNGNYHYTIQIARGSDIPILQFQWANTIGGTGPDIIHQIKTI